MNWSADAILTVLDDCCRVFTFPALDNGYIYPAASRLALYRSAADWALVIEVFGFMPRAGLPDTTIYTFGSQVVRKSNGEGSTKPDAWERYLVNNPHNESATIHPLEEGDWQDEEDEMFLGAGSFIRVRGREVALPRPEIYEEYRISLEGGQPQVFELCRYLAETMREEVLATPEERQMNVSPELKQILQLEEWHHPDPVSGEVASQVHGFRQLAEALATGDVSRYAPREEPNNHWSNWPDGGTL